MHVLIKKIFKIADAPSCQCYLAGNAWNYDSVLLCAGSKEAADSCGILIGTSHCEPMMRNNVGEWKVNERGDYNYITNREGVQSYWIERLKEAGPYENFYDHGYERYSRQVEWKGSRPFRKRPMHCNRLLTTSASYYRSM